ncbi:MAG TPA: 4-(cytidine 5'-diphospho)-2-C-methyl-D-erythritol kinase [Acidobacteriota bacterium]|nr:4-(cytidine 5'-diphospho)-2-C-methyl-D-erythritol kinase [Acidobacteriota bacterium]
MATEPTALCRIRAPAKINLGLRVLGRRPDGFHEIETTFAAVDLYDDLECRRTDDDRVRFTWEAPDPGFHAGDLDAGESNLIVRAVRALERARGFRAGLKIHLTKRIPIAAGLGGGSSDAAAALVAVDRLYHLGIPPTDLAVVGAELGSDVPFFLGPPCARGRGRGEQLEPRKLFRDWWGALVCPPLALKAGDIYAALDLTDRPSVPDTPQSLDGDGFFDAIGRLCNDLQKAVISRAPVVLYWCERLMALGAQGAFVSGSGPTVVGIFRTPPDRRKLDELNTDDAQVFIVRPVDTPLAMVIG